MENSRKERVGKLLNENANMEYFQKHFISFNRSVSTYYALKYIYDDKSKGLEYYEGFKSSFFRFYGIGRFTSDVFNENFYRELEQLRGTKLKYSKEFIEELTEKLSDNDKGKIQFSFVTKLLNIINDEEYPIYDSNVVMATFGRANNKSTDDKIGNYIEQYEVIRNIYNELLDDYKNIIGNFRKIFTQSANLSNMRILDIIVWKIGKEIIDKKIQLK